MIKEGRKDTLDLQRKENGGVAGRIGRVWNKEAKKRNLRKICIKAEKNGLVSERFKEGREKGRKKRELWHCQTKEERKVKSMGVKRGREKRRN